MGKLSQLMHKIYDLMLTAAGHKSAMYFLFLVSFAESSFFPIPPDVMIIPMVLAAPKNAWKIATVATIASILGGWFGYFIGSSLFDLIAKPLLEMYDALDKFHEFESYYSRFGAWIVFGAGLTPFPYKIITIASGAVHLNLTVFTIASILSRGARFFVVAWLLKRYGSPMKDFIEKNLGWLSVAFLLLLIGSFWALKLL